ncbi:hypothetical protein DPMN_015377 [Dreissena polymorpha]|uniref:Uncharacterized protein n=1 Tax=Dreissena polymorpha TaxID=45954 RepID=A0A9D4S3K2_DREPO|nr:hypothetical protein DPMN_015377 [Dreissena polymorpha]
MKSELPGSHVFQQTGSIFVHILGIIKTNILTKFHEDLTINVTFKSVNKFYYSHIWKNATPPVGHVFQPTGIILKLDWTINVASRVLTRQMLTDKRRSHKLTMSTFCSGEIKETVNSLCKT